MDNIADNSVDMVLCDLPYGTTQNKWDSVIDLPSLWKQYNRVCKANAAIALFCQGIFTAKLMISNEAWFKYKIVWEKSKPTNFLNAKKQPLRKHEDIAVFYKNQPVYNPQFTQGIPYSKGLRKDQQTGSYGEFSQVVVKSDTGKRYPTDIVYFKTAESESEKTVWHPTQKPVDLGRYLVRTYSNEGAVILDNAFGSGSFLVSAKLENRKYIGIEKEKEFFDIAQERLRRITTASTRLAVARELSKC
jgi:site-specific DNA-methyltransferase (adenine-specific)/modification methylase